MTEPSPMASVDKALLVLTELSSAGPQGRSLAELAAALGVAKSTLHRTLTALRHRHFVSQDATAGRYRLGHAALALSASFLDHEHLPALLHPLLEAVRDEFGELCQLGVLDGTEIVYLDKAEPPRAIRVWSEVGRRLPAITPALGRAILACQEVDRRTLSRFAPAAQFTDEEVARSWQGIVSARLEGYAQEDGDSEPGIGCVAVAVLRARRPTAAISVTMPAERLAPRLPTIGRRLRELVATSLPESLTVPRAL